MSLQQWKKALNLYYEVFQGIDETLFSPVDIIDLAISNHYDIIDCFCWNETPEGHNFWGKICNYGHTKESLKILNDVKELFINGGKPIRNIEEWL